MDERRGALRDAARRFGRKRHKNVPRLTSDRLKVVVSKRCPAAETGRGQEGIQELGE